MTETVYTPPPVAGYRKLTQTEVDLMNEIKAKAAECGALVDKLRAMAPPERNMPGPVDQRWVSIGATDLQTGFMALVRAVAQPTNF